MNHKRILFTESTENKYSSVTEDEKLTSVSLFFLGIKILLEMVLFCFTLLSYKCIYLSYIQQGARGPPGPKVGNNLSNFNMNC